MLYQYKAKHLKTNQIIKGESECEDEAALRCHLLEQYYLPIKVRVKTKKATKKAFGDRQMLLLCEQLKILIDAGIDMKEALQCIGDNMPSMKQIMTKITRRIEEGELLSVALQKEEVFSQLFIGAISSGEESGKLSEILHYLILHYTRKIKFRTKLKQAMTYPIFVLIIIIFFTTILIHTVLPTYVIILEESGVELPWQTQLLLKINDWVLGYGVILFIGLISIGLVIKVIWNDEIRRAYIETWLMKIPLIGKSKRYTICSMLCEMLYILLAAGIPLLEAIDMAGQMIDHALLRQQLQQVKANIRGGYTLVESFKCITLWPNLVVSMLGLMEKATCTYQVFEQMTRYLYDENDRLMGRMIVLIEPLLTILMAAVVGIVVMAMIMPTFMLANAII